MISQVSSQQLTFYRDNGYVIIPGMLAAAELDRWRGALAAAAHEHAAKSGYHNQDDDGYYREVFLQLVNLWTTSEAMRGLVLDSRLGKLAADLAGVAGVRLYHDHAMIKQPWANPTNWHIDSSGCPFFSRRANVLWIPLDDVTVQNGCLYFLPGSQRTSRFEVEGALNEANIGGLLAAYPEWRGIEPVAAEAKAGDGVFFSAMVAHAAGPNMTIHSRRAVALVYIPQGAVYNGTPHVLPPAVVARLEKGDPLEDDEHLPLVYRTRAVR